MQICNVDHDNDDDDGDNNDDDHDDDDDDDDLGQLFLSWAAAAATPPGHLIDWLIAHISFHYSPIFLPYFSFFDLFWLTLIITMKLVFWIWYLWMS